MATPPFRNYCDLKSLHFPLHQLLPRTVPAGCLSNCSAKGTGALCKEQEHTSSTARLVSPRHRRHPELLLLCRVLLPHSLLQKPTSAPKENKSESTTKYQQRQFWQNRLSENLVKIGRVIIKLTTYPFGKIQSEFHYSDDIR